MGLDSAPVKLLEDGGDVCVARAWCMLGPSRQSLPVSRGSTSYTVSQIAFVKYPYLWLCGMCAMQSVELKNDLMQLK